VSRLYKWKELLKFFAYSLSQSKIGSKWRFFGSISIKAKENKQYLVKIGSKHQRLFQKDTGKA